MNDKKQNKTEFIVSVKIPEGCSISAMKDYIRDAVGSMKGCKHPEDPLFWLDYKSVTVKKSRKEKSELP